MRLEDHFEVEFKLSVTGDDPEALLDEVAALDRLGSMRLGDCSSHVLHDIYWDLPDRGLRSHRLSLRLREIDDRLVFTAKGGTSSSDGLFRRYELEVPASRESWTGILAAFAEEGVKLNEPRDGDTPKDWLRAAGLVPTQDRVTRRTVRYAYPPGAAPAASEPGPEAVAELALDRTRFDFGAVMVDYWEIEIEQLDGGEDAPRALGQALLARYPDRLEPSKMGKYSRGLALEKELRESGQL